MTSRLSAGFWGIVLLVYLVLALRTAGATPLSYDEVYTVKLSTFSTPAQLWAWLRSGTDLNPPANYLLTRISLWAVGPTPVAARLPSVLAYGAAVTFLFVYLRRRHGSELAGWLGGLAMLACNLPYYAVIARAYALMVMWGALGLLLLHLAHTTATPRRRTLAGVGLGLVVAACLYTHYYGVFLLLPIAAAVGTHWWKTGRVNLVVSIPVVVGAASVVGLLPLIQTARSFSSGFWARASWADVELVYGTMLLNFASPLFAALAVLYLVRDPGERPVPDPGAPTSDAAMLGFLVIPAAGVALAMLTTGVFDKRYVVMGYVGGAALFGGGIGPRLRSHRVAAGFVLLVLAGWWLLGTELRYRKQLALAAETQTAVLTLRQHLSTEPAVVVDGIRYLEFTVAAPDLVDRMVHPADPERAREMNRPDTNDRNLIQLARVDARLIVRPFANVRLRPGTLVVGNAWPKDVWEAAGYRFELVSPGRVAPPVYRVTAVPHPGPE